MKQYDSLKLEAARLERDAQRVNLENAVIEGERLKKEAAILDVELDTVCTFFTHSYLYDRIVIIISTYMNRKTRL